jgi:uncharacterized protein (DUF2141 family)
VKRTSKGYLLFAVITLLLFTSAVHVPSSRADLSAVGPGGDGNVTLDDVAYVLEAMMSGQYDPRADLNKDGKVDRQDLDIIMELYQKSTGQQAGPTN